MAARPVIVATVNLRCRADEWEGRLPLVVAALARIAPDLVALQEDCVVPGTTGTQAEEVGSLLSLRTGRGYEFRRHGTHLANHVAGTFEEGVAVLSAHEIEGSGSVALPFVHFPRTALFVDVTVGGHAVRFYSTHLDFSPEAAQARADAAAVIVAHADGAADRTVFIGGDLNADPDSAAVATFTTTMVDLWGRANPSQPGLTFPAPQPTTRIDWVFTRPAMARGLRGARLLDERADGTVGVGGAMSDHFGVAVAVEWSSP